MMENTAVHSNAPAAVAPAPPPPASRPEIAPPREPRPQFACRKLERVIAAATPFHRTVVVFVHACHNGDVWESEVSIHPAIAVQTREIETYEIEISPGETDDFLYEFQNADALLDCGFRFVDRDILNGVLIDHPEYHTLEFFPDETFDCANGVGRVVICSWPESEDAHKLRPIIEELASEARQKAGPR